MPQTNWIATINASLKQLGLYPALEARAIEDAPNWVAWVSTQELTVLISAEGVAYAMDALPDTADLDEVWYAVQAHISEDAGETVVWDSVRDIYTLSA